MSLLSLLGTSAFGMEAPHDKLHRLLSEAQALADTLEVDTKLRDELVETSKQLTRTLQTPVDRAWELFFQPHHLSVLHTALDAGWLQLLTDAGDAGLSGDQLASSAPPAADASLVTRLMRVLASTGTVREIGVETYAATEFSMLFCAPEWGAGLRHASRDYSVSVAKMPQYFAENGLHSPPSADNGLYRYAYRTPFLQYLGQNVAAAKEFNTFMSAVREGKKPWTDTFPIDEKLHIDSADHVLLVDVGGGKGHDLLSISATQKDLGMKGKLILQDLPRVTTQVPEEWGKSFEIQAHDFFNPQPTIHARAYYFRNILHGWSDDDATTILSHIRDVMKPGYSKLLINEIVLPDAGCRFWGAAFDITMMALVNGRLRTERQWKELIGKVEGLSISGLWKVGSHGESLLEVDRES